MYAAYKCILCVSFSISYVNYRLQKNKLSGVLKSCMKLTVTYILSDVCAINTAVVKAK